MIPNKVEETALNGVRAILSILGQDPDREGIKETPARVLKAMVEMTDGYGMSPRAILERQFDSAGYDDLVVVRGIRFTSLCEHHLLPFVGTATVGYLPRDRVVGLSKIPRVVECYAHRLQLQEKLTREIAEAINEHLSPKGVGVHIVAQHQCMACRGVRQIDADMVTTTVLGAMRLNKSLKDEFIKSVYEGH